MAAEYYPANCVRYWTSTMKMRLEIDGAHFSDIESFYDEVSKILEPDIFWGRNLDAFNDILRGGFGTPDEGFILVWKNHMLSKSLPLYGKLIEIIHRHGPNGDESDSNIDLVLA
jgi:RNAse (barnase) inhibitor barstar